MDLDSTIGNTPVILPRANFGDRFFAFIVDNMMLRVPLNFLLFLASTISDLTSAIVLLLIPIVTLLYFSLFAYKHNGQTLGKK